MSKERSEKQIAAAQKLAESAKAMAAEKAKAAESPTAEQPAETSPVTDVIEDIIQDLQNAQAGMDIAIARLRNNGHGITRVVAQRQAVNAIIRALAPYTQA